MQERQPTYIGAVPRCRYDMTGFNTPLLAFAGSEPKRDFVTNGLGGFDIITGQDRNLLISAPQRPAGGGPEEAFDQAVPYGNR